MAQRAADDVRCGVTDGGVVEKLEDFLRRYRDYPKPGRDAVKLALDEIRRLRGDAEAKL